MKRLQFFILILIASSYGCKQNEPVSAEVYSDFLKGRTLWGTKPDSSFYYFNRVVNNTNHKLYIAQALYYMGTIQSDAGDYFGSNETLLKSLDNLDERNSDHHASISSTYNTLGKNNSDLKNYTSAIIYYDRALQFAQEDTDVVTLANKAVAYEKLKKYKQAESIYTSILHKAKLDMKKYARVLSNLAKCKWLEDSSYNAPPALLEALQIREDSNDTRGLNASYAHLSDYYSRSRPDSALVYARKMFAVAQEIHSPDDELEALDKLIQISPPALSKQYFFSYRSLSDSIQTARSAAKNQFALVRYEGQKNKAETLRLQRDSAQKETLLYVTGSSFLAAIAIAIIWYRKRQQRLALESQNMIREQQLKTSKKVHDVVANSIYRIMIEIEHKDAIEKGPLLDKLEVVYEQSRNLSYEPIEKNYHNFHKTISELLSTFATLTTRVVIVGNQKELWTGISEQVKKELEQVLQELMINMRKHSKAQNVVVKFHHEDGGIKIQYTDDGIGVPATFKFGNGLVNTENRINTIGGRITFDKELHGGLKIDIFFPIG
ncbi:MAG: ATP-binding protein [Chitinophagaceae bacterium]